MSTFNDRANITPHGAQRHKLGLTGHLKLDKELVNVAAEYGGTIHRATEKRQGHGTAHPLYDLRFPSGNGDMDFRGTARELTAYIKTLHQPIKHGVEQAFKGDPDYQSLKPYQKAFSQNKVTESIQVIREQTLSLLRVMTEDTPSLPEYKDGMGDEDHSKTEHSIRTANMWRHASEIVTDRNSGHDAPAIIPGSSFHPSKGFSFVLSDHFITNSTPSDHPMPMGDQLRHEIWDSLSKATHNRYSTETADNIKNQTIHLTPEDIEAFCADVYEKIKTQNLSALLQEAQKEKRICDAITRIEQSANTIESQPIQNLIRDPQNADPKARIMHTLKSHSALTPIIADDALEQRWKYYKFMNRADSPLEKIQEDMAVMGAVLTYYEQADHTTPLHIEALAQDSEFLGLLSFEKEMARSLQDAVTKLKGLDRQEKAELQRGYQAVQNTLQNTSASGMLLSRDKLDDDYRDVLDILERSFGNGTDGMKRVGKDFAFNTVDFFEDIYKRPFESKQSFVASCAVMAGIVAYMKYGLDPISALQTGLENSASAANNTMPDPAQAAQSVSEPVTETAGLSGLDLLGEAPDLNQLSLGDMTKESQRELLEKLQAAGTLDNMTEEQLAQIHPDLFHYNEGLIGKYKHFTFDNVVAGTTLTILDLLQTTQQGILEATNQSVQPQSNFYSGAQTGAMSTSDVLATANLAQNTAGHYPLMASLLMMGVASGLRNGAKRIFGFFDDFTNSVISTVKDRPQVPLAAGYTHFFEPQAYLIVDEAQRGGIAFPLMAAIGASFLWKRKPQSAKDLHECVTNTSRHLMNDINGNAEEWSLQDPRQEMVQTLHKAAHLQESIRNDLPEDIKEITLKKGMPRPGLNLKNDFRIAADNLEPTITALHKFDLAMDIATRHMDIDNNVYHSYIHGKVEGFIQSLKDVQNDKLDVETFSTQVNKDLKSILAAQNYIGGTNTIYETIYGKAPTTKTQRRLNHHGKVEFGKYARVQAREERAQNIETLRSRYSDITNTADYTPLHERTPLTAFTHKFIKTSHDLDISAKIAWEKTKQSLSPVWGAVCQSARMMQAGYNEIPGKKYLAGGTLGGALTLAGLDMSGAVDLPDTSFSTGYALGAAGAFGMFMMVNPIDDLIVAHLGLGGSAYGVGGAIHTANKYVVDPAFEYSREKYLNLAERLEQTRDNLRDAAQAPPISASEYTTEDINETCMLCNQCVDTSDEHFECTKDVPVTILAESGYLESQRIPITQENG